MATSDGQGGRNSDFAWTVEGELVRIGSQCDIDRDDIDGGCGCLRAMVGLASSKSTTTFRVAELDLSQPDYEELVYESMVRDGWGIPPRLAAGAADELLGLAAEFPVGVPLGRRGDVIQIRESLSS